jgi:hypothetical protein
MRKRESKYPWEQWTNTQAWMAEQYEEFDCQPESFRGQVHLEARHRNMKVATTIVGRKVFFWFFPTDNLWKPNLEALPAVREAVRKLRNSR